MSAWLGEFWTGFWLGIMLTWTPCLVALAWLVREASIAPRRDQERNRAP